MSDSSLIKETDIYKINASDVSTQRETTWENILEYFDSYIKPYTPYKDEPTYKAMISFIVKYYVDLIYNVQPEIFKDMFEKQIIRTDVVDLLLVSIGLPETLIRSITSTSKFIILRSFSDFERYQGTVKFFRSLGGSFTDTVSFYELYIDYDDSYVNPPGEYVIYVDKDNISPGSYFLVSSTKTNYYVWFNFDESGEDPLIDGRTGLEIKYGNNSTAEDIAREISICLNRTSEFYSSSDDGDIIRFQLAEHGPAAENPSSGTTHIDIKTETSGKSQGAWILRPRPIFIHPKMTQLKETFSYRAAYNKIPTLLVPEEQLEELHQAEEIIIPTKSNIILMDYTQTIDASPFNTLIFTILMEEIGEDSLTLYLSGSDETTTITYNTAVYTWFYLMARYYGVTLEGVSAAHHIVMGTNKSTDYDVNDLDDIQAEYDSISTRQQLVDFYEKYFLDQFGRPYYEVEKPTIKTMSETLKKMDSQFWEYIEQRLAESEDEKQDVRFLLDEMYASIVLSFHLYGSNGPVYKYSPVILQFITQITTSIKNTDSYKIMYNLKPFHTELLDLAHDKIEINDKFNSLLFDDETVFLYNLALADLLHMADEALFSFTPKKDGDSLSLVSHAVPNTRLMYTEDMFDKAYRDLSVLLFVKTAADAMRMSDTAECLFSPEQKDNTIGIIDRICSDGKFVQTVGPWVKDNPKMKVLETFMNHFPIFNKLNFHFAPSEENDRISMSDHASEKSTLNSKSENIAKDEAFPKVTKTVLEDAPYMSDGESFLYRLKNDDLGIDSKLENIFSFTKKSDIALNDSIQIKHKRSLQNV